MTTKTAPRTGNCYQDSMDKLLSLANPNAFLVHGLPMGQGEIAQYGCYPHAWLELGAFVWESRLDEWLPATLYYELGQIEFAVRYSMRETQKTLLAKNTYGPWPQELLDRDNEIDQMFKEQTA